MLHHNPVETPKVKHASEAPEILDIQCFFAALNSMFFVPAMIAL